MPQKHNNSLLEETVDNANCLLREAIELYNAENYKVATEKLSLAHKIFLAHKDIANVSVCLSLNGLIKYLDKEESYYKSLLLIEDSKFLAESTNIKSVVAVNKFSFACVYFFENKYNEALFYFNNAIENLDEYALLKIKAYEYTALSYIKLPKPVNEMKVLYNSSRVEIITSS